MLSGIGQFFTIDAENIIPPSTNKSGEFFHYVEVLDFTENTSVCVPKYTVKATFLPQEEKDKLFHRMESYLE